MNISFLGTGLMGAPMVEKLLEAGHNVTIYNRTESKTSPLKNLGAFVVNTTSEAIKKNNIIILMLSDYQAVNEVLFSDDSINCSDKTILQMSTISPDENIRIKEKIENEGGKFIEAPVLGSIPQVKSGSLFVLVGAKADEFTKWEKFLKIFGENVIHFGEVGKASAAKLALNQLIVTLTSSFSMSLGYLRNMDVDLEKFLKILRGSSLYAPTFDKKLDKMMERNFENPNFPVKHLLKDVNLMADQFGKSGIDASILHAIQDILKHSINNGEAELDYSALYNSIHPRQKDS